MKAFLHAIFYGKPLSKKRRVFNVVLCAVVILNILAIIFQTSVLPVRVHHLLHAFNVSVTMLFALEYVLRVAVCPTNRVRYIFGFLSLVDIISIFPALLAFTLGVDWTYLTILRMFRVFKLFSHLRSMKLISAVFEKTYKPIFLSLTLIGILTVLASTLMYFAEHTAQPAKFPSIFASMYWAIITITGVGYGDVTPITYAGKIIACFISIIGVFAFAIPTGIISAGFISEFNRVIQLRKERRNLMSPGGRQEE